MVDTVLVVYVWSEPPAPPPGHTHEEDLQHESHMRGETSAGSWFARFITERVRPTAARSLRGSSLARPCWWRAPRAPCSAAAP
eukprot:882438-Prymnesium_polylepis.1